MESSLKNMVLTLGAITLVAATGLGLAYSVTKEPIEISKSAKTIGALSNVIDDFDNNPAADTVTIILDAMPIKVYAGKKGGDLVGYAVETQTKSGFSGLIKMMVGFKPDGEITNIVVLLQNETPGLGSKIADPNNVLLVSFVGKSPETLKMKVTKDGGDIDAITASTITSRAYVDAVERAYKAFRQVAFGETGEQKIPEDPFDKVLPGHENNPIKNKTSVTFGKETVQIYTGIKGGEVLGYAVESESDGYGGMIKMLVGFNPDGEIIDIEIMEHNETEGYGAKMIESGNALKNSLIGSNLHDIDMTASLSELHEHGIDGLTGATITSEAYIKAVKQAYDAFKTLKPEEVQNE